MIFERDFDTPLPNEDEVNFTYSFLSHQLTSTILAGRNGGMVGTFGQW